MNFVIISSLLLIGANLVASNDSAKPKEQTIDRAAVKKMAERIIYATEAGDDPKIMKEVRELVKSMPRNNLKMIGIDFNAWTLKVGTMTYYEGDFTDITLAPFWPSMKNYAHILHNEGEGVDGLGYIRGETIITRENAVASAFRATEVPDSVTKVLVYGEGNVTVDEAEETSKSCAKLEKEWNNILTELGPDADDKTLIVLTDDLYCPTRMRKLAGRYYRDLRLETGFASDGTAIDVVTNTIRTKSSKTKGANGSRKEKNFLEKRLEEEAKEEDQDFQ